VFMAEACFRASVVVQSSVVEQLYDVMTCRCRKTLPATRAMCVLRPTFPRKPLWAQQVCRWLATVATAKAVVGPSAAQPPVGAAAISKQTRAGVPWPGQQSQWHNVGTGIGGRRRLFLGSAR